MRIHGMEKPTGAKVEAALASGGRFIMFEDCISLVFVTLRRPTDSYYLPPKTRGLFRGLPYTALSLLLGW